MPELLLEVGCEELPAAFLPKAYVELADHLKEALGEAYQTTFTATSLGTPRRLIVSINDLPEVQPDAVKELRGPGLKAAYDDAGNPTKALLGFCRSQELDLETLRKDEQYVWATKVIPGKPTLELLATLIPAAIRKLTFEKSMRWGPHGAKFRFARPIRWILSVYNSQLISFEFEGVESGAHSHGHRFYAPEPFEALNLEALVTGLRSRKVEPDPDVRRELLVNESIALAQTVELPEALIDENVFLTEWPTPILGEFKKEFLELPEPVLTTAMAKHEKMFPIRDGDNKLTNQFIFIRNSGEDATVRRGAEWVLNARLADADFFYREDKKYTMDDFLEKTKDIVFQAQLGTVWDRAQRLSHLCRFLASSTVTTDIDPEVAAKAGLYAKADLSTGLVAEFNSLQGVIGDHYCRRPSEDFPIEVARAIGSQYVPIHQNWPNPYTTILILADSLDKLAGYLGIRILPSGSADPFGLRRAATNLIELRFAGDHTPLFNYASELYQNQGYALGSVYSLDNLLEILISRYEALFSSFRHDIVQAAIYGGTDQSEGPLNPNAVRDRVQWLNSLVHEEALTQTLLRPLNIYKSFKEEPTMPLVWESHLDSDSGQTLAHLINETSSADPAERLKILSPAIHAFFESTMIMAEEPVTRASRQYLVALARTAILKVGDFTRIVIDGN